MKIMLMNPSSAYTIATSRRYVVSLMDAITTIIKMTLVEIRLRPSSRSQMDGPLAMRAMYKAMHASNIQITYIKLLLRFHQHSLQLAFEQLVRVFDFPAAHGFPREPKHGDGILA